MFLLYYVAINGIFGFEIFGSICGINDIMRLCDRNRDGRYVLKSFKSTILKDYYIKVKNKYYLLIISYYINLLCFLKDKTKNMTK